MRDEPHTILVPTVGQERFANASGQVQHAGRRGRKLVDSLKVMIDDVTALSFMRPTAPTHVNGELVLKEILRRPGQGGAGTGSGSKISSKGDKSISKPHTSAADLDFTSCPRHDYLAGEARAKRLETSPRNSIVASII
jgi:hypothetical protein